MRGEAPRLEARKRLPGLTSRCTSPATCTSERPAHACIAYSTATQTASGEQRRTSSARSTPSSRSITRNGNPESSRPDSKTRTTCSPRARAANSASRAKRARTSTLPHISGRSVFTATRHCSARSRASRTIPIPPPPSTRPKRYRPATIAPSVGLAGRSVDAAPQPMPTHVFLPPTFRFVTFALIGSRPSDSNGRAALPRRSPERACRNRNMPPRRSRRFESGRGPRAARGRLRKAHVTPRRGAHISRSTPPSSGSEHGRHGGPVRGIVERDVSPGSSSVGSRKTAADLVFVLGVRDAEGSLQTAVNSARPTAAKRQRQRRPCCAGLGLREPADCWPCPLPQGPDHGGARRSRWDRGGPLVSESLPSASPVPYRG